MSDVPGSFLVSCPKGCEVFLRDELLSLNIENPIIDDGGVSFIGTWTDAQKVCLWSRIASRVYLPLACVNARDGEQIYQNCYNMEWEQWLDTACTFAIQGIGTNENIRHSGFLALKIKDAIVDRMRKKTGFRPNIDKENPDVRFVARLVEDKLDLSLDISGESLHKRGWRKGYVGDAPIKENLAAALIRASGYDGSEPFMDPMCGSGTIVIEAIELALGWAPGRRRRFKFEQWPFLPRSLKRDFRDRRQAIRKPSNRNLARVYASDFSEDAMLLTAKHLEATGLKEYVSMSIKDARNASFPEGKGVLLTNPPYGERMAVEDDELLKMYKELGEAWKKFPDARLAVFCAHPKFRKAFALKTSAVLEFANGPIPTKLFIYNVGARWTPPETKQDSGTESVEE